MLNPFINKLSSILTHNNRCYFGIGGAFMQYLRTTLNRIRWQENRQFTSLQQRQNSIPTNTEQANKLFIATEQERSLSQGGRMERIDRILGTKTHFYEVKPYQQRLDSDHVMDLQELQKLHKEKSRKVLNWQNPQAEVKVRYKNKKQYYNLISKLRIYPTHQAKNYDFNDQVNENTINFLGKQAIYSKISLKEVELVVESMQSQVIGLTSQKPFESQKFIYFRPLFTMQMFRIEKKLYIPELTNDQAVLAKMQTYLQPIISIDQIYDIMKEYDQDERVHQYLKKVQNGRIDYLFSDFINDQAQNVVAIMIDLLGTRKEYCMFVKSLSLNSKDYNYKVIFNVRPKAMFSSHGTTLFYVQRSEEGGWVELVSTKVQKLWYKKTNQVSIWQDQQNQVEEVVYRCSVDKQISLGTDSNKNYIFLAIKDFNRQYGQSLFIVHQKQNEGKEVMEIIKLDEDGTCKYHYDVSPLGIVYVKYHQITNSFLKYGKNTKEAKEIYLIPYKQHIQVHQQQKVGMTDCLIEGTSKAVELIPPTEFDINNKTIIYKAGQHQFIKEMQVRSSHLVIVLNLFSVYNKAILYFLPFKPTAHPHSIILSGGTYIKLRPNNYSYDKQIVQFTKSTGLIQTQKVYNIWKKQLSDGCSDLKRYHTQKIIISEEQEYPLQITILCRSLYAQDKNLPVVIYFPTRNDEINGVTLRQLLEKGVMVVEFRGRGTFAQDLQHYLKGCKSNIVNMFDDLQSVIEFVGNNMTKNISLYCKGEISSLVGFWFNVYFPFLFNTTVLHNGIYDLEDQLAIKQFQDFFGTVNSKDQAKSKEFKELWERFNLFKLKFKPPFSANRPIEQGRRQIGTLQNMIISSDKDHRIHSRKLIHRLRQNITFKYEQVYLREYDNQYETDLSNLSYIYSKVRQRMETQINDPANIEDQIRQQEQKERNDGVKEQKKQ